MVYARLLILMYLLNIHGEYNIMHDIHNIILVHSHGVQEVV